MPKLTTSAQVRADDEWDRRATAAALAAVRALFHPIDGCIAPGTPVARLSDVEIGWVIASVLFAWIRIRAEQATAEGANIDQLICRTMCDPKPWDAGAVAAILPKLAEIEGLDFGKPIANWSKSEMTAFLLRAFNLIADAMAARDASSRGITRQRAPEVAARGAIAAAGGPLMVPDELKDLTLI